MGRTYNYKFLLKEGDWRDFSSIAFSFLEVVLGEPLEAGRERRVFIPSLDRQYKFRADWEGSQYWIDPIDIIHHQVNEIDMDLDLLGLNLTGQHLYANNRNSKIQLAMAGFPYGLLLNSVIAASSVTESIYYYHNDHLGTPQVLTDDNAQVVWKADYKPFGEVDIVVETVESNFRFPGQYFDQETGLHYNYHRYYHSGIGKYLRVDPIGVEGGINGYLYANNSPVNFIDPCGLKVEKCCGMTSRMPKHL